MSYDWKEIMKSKSIKELFEIATGRLHLDKEAMNAAEDELKNRNFSLDNKEPIRNNIEFESLVKEQEEEDFRLKNSLLPPIESKYFSKEAATIILLMIGVLLILFLETSMLDKIIHSIILTSFLIYYVFNIKRKKDRALFRKGRIDELKKLL